VLVVSFGSCTDFVIFFLFLLTVKSHYKAVVGMFVFIVHKGHGQVIQRYMRISTVLRGVTVRLDCLYIFVVHSGTLDTDVAAHRTCWGYYTTRIL
jgi:hypothetical protein